MTCLHCRPHGPHFQIVTVKTSTCAPVIVATRLRKGSANSGRGAASLLREALKTVRALGVTTQMTGTIRRRLINIPARIATGARRLTLHLSQHWRRDDDFTDLWIAHAHLNQVMQLPARDPKDHPNPPEGGDQNSRGGSRINR